MLVEGPRSGGSAVIDSFASSIRIVGLPRRVFVRLTVVVALAGVSLTWGSVAGAVPAAAAFGPAIDPLPSLDRQSTCDPTPKPGAIALQHLLETTYPSTSSMGIGRSCSSSCTGISEHKEGRAYDWAVNAAVPAQLAMAQEFLTWLLATDRYGNDYAMVRRLGVMYVIWNRHIWKAYAPQAGWQPYLPDPTRPCYSPHTDHVHFSLSRDGGNALTSWHHPSGDWAATRVTAEGGRGYWLPTDRGLVFPFSAPSFGGLPAQPRFPTVGIARTATGAGYWQVASDGGIFTAGDAPFLGSAGDIPLNQPIVGMASTPSGRGYWLVARDGGIFAYGDAGYFGSTASVALNRPIVGMASTLTGLGYWLVASDGGVFAYGDAAFQGSTGNLVLNRPVVGMAPTATGGGYWMVASDGGIFAYGDALFRGSAGGTPLASPVRAMAATATGAGYWIVAADGGVFTYGDAAFRGSAAGIGLNVTGITPYR